LRKADAFVWIMPIRLSHFFFQEIIEKLPLKQPEKPNKTQCASLRPSE